MTECIHVSIGWPRRLRQRLPTETSEKEFEESLYESKASLVSRQCMALAVTYIITSGFNETMRLSKPGAVPYLEKCGAHKIADPLKYCMSKSAVISLYLLYNTVCM